MTVHFHFSSSVALFGSFEGSFSGSLHCPFILFSSGGNSEVFLGIVLALLEFILPALRAGPMDPRVHEVGPSAPGY